MFQLDRRNNITLNTGDNAVIDFSLCGETLKDGDRVIFTCGEQETVVTSFVQGVGKILIVEKDVPFEGTYCIQVIMADGRKSITNQGKYVRKGGC